MVTNVSFALLDAAIVAGHGEDPVVGTTTHARLLEEVAALGGVLRHLGVAPGVPVLVDLPEDEDAVVAALAVARIGGVVTTPSADLEEAPVALVAADSPVTADGRVRLVRGGPVTDPDLDWDVMIRAGRSDPAATEVLDPGAAYSPERSVADEIELLSTTSAPYEPGELRELLGA
jgi:acyl-CoA synthetase (AMP-forming)/AMP-acid ligase II